MNTLEVISIGLGVVFVTLGILTASTYFFSWIINRFFVKGDDNDELEKVAAIVAAVRSKGDNA